MTIEVHGDADAGYGAMADEFRRNFAERKELGAACAVVRDGNLVVDLWGGYRDKRRRQPWQRDTLVTVWSTTKGMSAAAMAVAHSRGLFNLDECVATYWPEFAQASKETVTVRQLLEHEAGLAVIDQPLDLHTVGDPDILGAVLAAQKPSWTPGDSTRLSRPVARLVREPTAPPCRPRWAHHRPLLRRRSGPPVGRRVLHRAAVVCSPRSNRNFRRWQ